MPGIDDAEKTQLLEIVGQAQAQLKEMQKRLHTQKTFSPLDREPVTNAIAICKSFLEVWSDGFEN